MGKRIEGEPPLFEQTEPTDDQVAVLEALGNPWIIRRDWSPEYYVEASVRDDIPSIAPQHRIRYLCPVVFIAGKKRKVMPNGDLHAVHE